MRALSFFTGAMGLDLGMEKAGFDILLAAELNPAARATIGANRPHLPIIEDVSFADASGVRRMAGLGANETIDLVFGGPPCQSFSTAGKRLGLQDARGNLLLHFVDLILGLNPRFAVIENVRGLLSAPLLHRPHHLRGEGFPPLSLEEQKGGVLKEVLRRLSIGNYQVSFALYNSADFGCPQIRQRVILICARDGEKPPYLVSTHAEFPTSDRIPWRTFREATQGLEEKQADYIPFPERRLRYFRMLKAGQNWRHLPSHIQKEAMGEAYQSGGGKTGFFRRLAWDRPSPTLVTHPAMPATDLAHPEKDRPLSIQEYIRIQGFPGNWKFAGNLLDKYRQVGNAVPVEFAGAIGQMLSAMIAGRTASGSTLHLLPSSYRRMDDRAWRAMQK